MSLRTLKRRLKMLGLKKSCYCFNSCYKADHREGNRRPVQIAVIGVCGTNLEQLLT